MYYQIGDSILSASIAVSGSMSKTGLNYSSLYNGVAANVKGVFITSELMASQGLSAVKSAIAPLLNKDTFFTYAFKKFFKLLMLCTHIGKPL